MCDVFFVAEQCRLSLIQVVKLSVICNEQLINIRIGCHSGREQWVQYKAWRFSQCLCTDFPQNAELSRNTLFSSAELCSPCSKHVFRIQSVSETDLIENTKFHYMKCWSVYKINVFGSNRGLQAFGQLGKLFHFQKL